MSSCLQTETEQEQRALNANDIRVLVGQLNESVRKGAECGLKIQIEISGVLDVKGSATYYPVIAAQVAAEVR